MRVYGVKGGRGMDKEHRGAMHQKLRARACFLSETQNVLGLSFGNISSRWNGSGRSRSIF